MMEENIFGHAAEYWEDQRSSGLTIERGEQDQSKKELDLKNYIYFGRTCLIQTKVSWKEWSFLLPYIAWSALGTAFDPSKLSQIFNSFFWVFKVFIWVSERCLGFLKKSSGA